MALHSRAPKIAAWCFCLLAVGSRGVVSAEGLSFSAETDKTSISLGSALTLTLTARGDLQGATVNRPDFPDGLLVVARSQASNFSMRGGLLERSTSLVYVLAPQRPGTFRIGPFTLQHHGKTYTTAPIDIVVSRPALPPNLKPNEDRYYL